MSARASDDTDAVSFTEARTGMSARSSTGSWHDQRAGDMIDLDRYMRREGHYRDDRLVVDAGGPKVVPIPPVASLGSFRRPKSSSSTSVCKAPAPVRRDKRYSHDSGLSETSYKRRPHRRATGEAATRRDRERTGHAGSSKSMRSFRVACEKALKEQQEQIARVTQLCERLAVNNNRGETAPEPARGGAVRNLKKASGSCTQDSSDISSSSESLTTKDNKARKDKHRTNECKTYKIIMTKLDELNRVFAARAQPTPRRRPAPVPSPAVSVADKLVATDKGRLAGPIGPASHLIDRGVGIERREQVIVARLAAARAHQLDIAPTPRAKPARSGRLNVASDRVTERESDGDDSLAQIPRLKFDLDDPVHVYYQTKCQANAQKQSVRAHSTDYARSNEKSHNHYTSLCGRCQYYWRTLSALATQLFYKCDKDNVCS